jgi:hypothetical protein
VPDLAEIRGAEAAINSTPAQDSTTQFATDTRHLSFLGTDALFMEQDTLSKPAFIYIQSAGNWYVLPAQRRPKPILRPWLADRGVRSVVLPVMLKPGSYRIGWVRNTPTGWLATLTQQVIDIPLPRQ